MKLFIKAIVLALFTMSLFHGDASAATNLTAKCGAIKPNVNPTFQQLNCLLTNAAKDADVPPEVVKAIAWQENGWKQFDANGKPIIAKDGGIGLMQITNLQNYDQEKLKTDILFNIQTGVKILSDMYDDRGDLPKIKGADRHVLENWYFPVMAYNGIKPVNSPFFKSNGLRNYSAYQEKVFAKIEKDSFLLGFKLGQIPFQISDFQYDSTSDKNIVFLEKEYILDETQQNKSSYFLNKGEKAYATVDGAIIRKLPSTTSTKLKVLVKNTPLIINGEFTYDQTANKQNQFVWYPVKTVDQKVVGYISSANITPPTVCTPYHKGQKLMWDGLEMKVGQIGRLTVLQNTTLYKLDGDKEIPARTLNKGEFYRIYTFKTGWVGLGGGYYVKRDTTVKYESPSKSKLIGAKCIASL